MSLTPATDEGKIAQVRQGGSLKVTPINSPSVSRRGSGVITTPTGSTVAFHTRTAEERDANLPHA
jgi:hexokinase